MNKETGCTHHRNSLKVFNMKGGKAPNDAQALYWMYQNYLNSPRNVQKQCEKNKQVLNVAKQVYEAVNNGEDINELAVELQNHIQGEF